VVRVFDDGRLIAEIIPELWLSPSRMSRSNASSIRSGRRAL
jgi:hypothetical protein